MVHKNRGAILLSKIRNLNFMTALFFVGFVAVLSFQNCAQNELSTDAPIAKPEETQLASTFTCPSGYVIDYKQRCIPASGVCNFNGVTIANSENTNDEVGSIETYMDPNLSCDLSTNNERKLCRDGILSGNSSSYAYMTCSSGAGVATSTQIDTVTNTPVTQTVSSTPTIVADKNYKSCVFANTTYNGGGSGSNSVTQPVYRVATVDFGSSCGSQTYSSVTCNDGTFMSANSVISTDQMFSTCTVQMPDFTNELIEINSFYGGERSQCFIKGNGKLTCLGVDSNTGLSSGTLLEIFSDSSSKLISSATGLNAMCAVYVNSFGESDLKCWGSASYGRLGSLVENSNSIYKFPDRRTPALPPSGQVLLKNIKKVAGQYTHFCAMNTDGELYCWGYNYYGQLGNKNNDTQYLATKVNIDNKRIKDFDVGQSHTCAITQDGALYCWGRNDYGQLGIGSRVSVNVPTLVSGALAPKGQNRKNVKQVSLSDIETCALTYDSDPKDSEGDEVFCWGYNNNGELGNGTTDLVLSPTSSNSTKYVSAISVGQRNTCVIQNQKLLCAGQNSYRQFGNGAGGSSNISLFTKVGGETLNNLDSDKLGNVLAVKVGYHDACVLLADKQTGKPSKYYCSGLAPSLSTTSQSYTFNELLSY